MATNAIVALQNLNCFGENSETDGTSGSGSSPYIWPALVWISPTGLVEVVSPPVESARLVIQNGMHTGQTADIPASEATLQFEYQNDQPPQGLILAVALWQKNSTPDNALNAGYLAFADGLQKAISANLLQLASTDETVRQAAIAAVKMSVKQSVSSAIANGLSDWEKFEIWLGALTLDSVIDNSSTVFSSLVPAPFTLVLGGSLSDQLLLYHDTTQDGMDDVNTPAVVGTGDWAHYKFVFSGGNGIIYAVNQGGQLLFYRDYTQDGTGDVDTPSTIGQGGWQAFTYLFSEGNGVIYAVQAGAVPKNCYEINGRLDFQPILCSTQRDQYNRAEVALNEIKQQLAVLEEEFATASANEKAIIRLEIKELEQNQLAPAQAALNQALQALNACLGRAA